MTLRRIADDPAKAAHRSMILKARRESLSEDTQRRIEAALLAAPVVLPKPPAPSLHGLVARGVLGATVLALVAAFVVASEKPEPPKPTRAPPAATGVLQGTDVHLPPSALVEEVALSVHDLPEAAPSASAAAGAPASAGPGDSLGAEAALLRAIREDTASGRGSDALRKLEQYDVRFRGKGAMGEEASVERVEALDLTGDARAARALATKLLEERPNGPFARKLRSLLANDVEDSDR